MSADNFVGVRPNADGMYSVFEYGNMSIETEDCMYLATEMGEELPTREAALVRAHDLVNAMDICEYGVMEMHPVPEKPCGRCFECVHTRGIISDDLPKCDVCEKPITEGEWTTGYFDTELDKLVTAHSRCARR